MGEEMQQRLAAETRSTVSFDLESYETMTSPVLARNGFDVGSANLASLAESWPRIMSRMKTYLERGVTQGAGGFAVTNDRQG
jgi:hypothetical protein